MLSSKTVCVLGIRACRPQESVPHSTECLRVFRGEAFVLKGYGWCEVLGSRTDVNVESRFGDGAGLLDDVGDIFDVFSGGDDSRRSFAVTEVPASGRRKDPTAVAGGRPPSIAGPTIGASMRSGVPASAPSSARVFFESRPGTTPLAAMIFLVSLGVVGWVGDVSFSTVKALMIARVHRIVLEAFGVASSAGFVVGVVGDFDDAEVGDVVVGDVDGVVVAVVTVVLAGGFVLAGFVAAGVVVEVFVDDVRDVVIGAVFVLSLVVVVGVVVVGGVVSMFSALWSFACGTAQEKRKKGNVLEHI
ncbi:hypothetical protein MTO96_018839 [Rhipicephalus appendiculatus]